MNPNTPKTYTKTNDPLVTGKKTIFTVELKSGKYQCVEITSEGGYSMYTDTVQKQKPKSCTYSCDVGNYGDILLENLYQNTTRCKWLLDGSNTFADCANLPV